mgnify:FL=1
MATWDEIHRALGWIKSMDAASSPPITLLHGVAQYPATLEDQNLLAIDTLLFNLSDSVGLSDHTLGYEAAVIAVARGASMIEKHFVLDPVVYSLVRNSPDFPHSAGPTAFAEMVRAVRRAEGALGDGRKDGPLPCEMALYNTARRSNNKPLRG